MKQKIYQIPSTIFLQNFSNTLEVSNASNKDIASIPSYKGLSSSKSNLVGWHQKKIDDEKQKLKIIYKPRTIFHKSINAFYDTYLVCNASMIFVSMPQPYALPITRIKNRLFKNVNEYLIKEGRDSITDFIKYLPYDIRYYKTQSDKTIYRIVNDFTLKVKAQFSKVYLFWNLILIMTVSLKIK